MKKILITRQPQQNQALINYLEKNNCQIFCEALFKIEEIFSENDSVKFYNQKIIGVILTSQNAIASFKKFYDKYQISKANGSGKIDFKIFAVGKKTAKKLNDLGFEYIIYPQIYSAKNLAKIVKKNLDDKSGLILYFRGEVISYDLKKSLIKSGFNCQEIISYRTIFVEKFSQSLIKNIENFGYDEIVIFSMKSLELFFLLAKKHNLLEYFAKSSLIVFSQQIVNRAEELTKQNFKFKKIEKFSDNIILKNFYE